MMVLVNVLSFIPNGHQVSFCRRAGAGGGVGGAGVGGGGGCSRGKTSRSISGHAFSSCHPSLQLKCNMASYFGSIVQLYFDLF